MKIKIQYIAFLLLLTGIQKMAAQKKDENIGTEVVNVVKPYTPTISDAFKVKETPALEDEDNTKKEPIKYTIFSFPVASTFTPSKGRAAGVDKPAEERLFKNYFTSGFGNYMNAFAELYVTQDMGDTDYAAGSVKYLSSNGGIKDIQLDDKFMNAAVDLTYGSKGKDFSWNGDLGYQIQKYYWYGQPDNYGALLSAGNRELALEKANQTHTYHNFYLGGKIGFNESIFNTMSLKFDRFWDNYGSAENRFYVKPTLTFDIAETDVKTDIIVDYVGGKFDKDYSGITAIDYGFTNLGLHPRISMHKDDWSFELGAAAYYSLAKQGDNKFFIYPKAMASLKVVGDLMVFYVGADGDLQQNSYRDFTNENPYVSPTLAVAPTDKQLDAYAGLKGKLANAISYDVRGSMIKEKNKPLFMANDYKELNVLQEVYQYGNSFGLVYDDVRTLRFFGELKADFSKNVSAGINGTFQKYRLDHEAEAWNLPEIKLGANLDVTITPKWYAGADVFYVGDRKDHQENLSIVPIVAEDNIKTVKGYFDANAHVGFKYNQRLTAFLRLNNIGNQAYQKWLNYPVQSFQVMLGANFKFDF